MSWDTRHHINPSKDNPRNHEFFRQYFDKPYGARAVRVVSPKKSPILDPPNLQATLEKNLSRIPRVSAAVPFDTKPYELGWNHRANVTFSKDNDYIHARHREYFDSPRDENSSSQLENGNRTFSSSFRSRSIRTGGLRSLSMSFAQDPRTSFELRQSYDPSGRKSKKEKTWKPAYMPMSEFNVVKHKDLRTYFDSSSRGGRLSV